MDKKKLWRFIIFLPFALAIGAFILYLRYYFELKSKANTQVSELIEVYLVRYKNIGLVCLAIGVFLLFIKTLIDYFKVDKEEDYIEEKGVLNKISSRKEEKNTKYTLSESKIISDLLKGKMLKAVFVNSDTEKLVKFKDYNSDKGVIKFYDLDEPKKEVGTINEPVKKEYVVINSDEVELDSNQFTKCKKCKNIIAKDSIMCVHCGTVFKEEKKKDKKKFNPVIFAINLIVILLCFILVLLIITKINQQVETNKNNLNISYTVEK